MLGIVLLILVVSLGVFAPWITDADPGAIDIGNRLLPPGATTQDGRVHLLGTDGLGRDVLARLAYGARISLLVGFSAVFIAGTAGIILGVIAGYFRGVADTLIMRLAEIQLAFPFILLAITVMAVLGPGLAKVIAVLGFDGWVQYGRIVRGQVLSLREKDFVESARATGVPPFRLITRHILPNAWAPVIVIATFYLASTIIAEASLSFLGLGVPPEVPTWGSMLAEGREYIELAPWVVTFPGLCLALTVLGFNLLGDWLRDYLDPRLRSN